MLDAFLEHICEKTKQAEATDRLQALLNKLPTRELMKIANCAPLAKAAGGDGGCWLDQFRGTPLLDQAIEIEKAELEVQMEDAKRTQMRNEVDLQYPWLETDMKRQELTIKRKLLELELVGAEVGGQEGEDLDAPPDLEAAEATEMPQVPKAEAPAGPPPAMPAPEEAPVAHEEGPPAPPPAAAAAAEDKPKEDKPKPPVTKVTKETTEKPTPEKVDIKTAAARMRFSMAAQSIKEAQPAGRAGSFRQAR